MKYYMMVKANNVKGYATEEQVDFYINHYGMNGIRIAEEDIENNNLRQMNELTEEEIKA